MTTKKPLYRSVTEANGSISISSGECEYRFLEPLGRHLVAMEKYQTSNPENTEVETMAFLMAQLEADGLPMSYFLDLPLKLFKFIASELNEFFRVEDIEAV